MPVLRTQAAAVPATDPDQFKSDFAHIGVSWRDQDTRTPEKETLKFTRPTTCVLRFDN